ncbi:acyl carrier protein [Sphingomonas endolithica]|uniref:acyl carrier protein n=1 Tax=Sphingomonas endolithica TaxID=2972485 RepID=UPI0021AFB36A|nr:acyl carrier protein [Sphingomonas sp. ZFBP2030]
MSDAIGSWSRNVEVELRVAISPAGLLSIAAIVLAGAVVTGVAIREARRPRYPRVRKDGATAAAGSDLGGARIVTEGRESDDRCRPLPDIALSEGWRHDWSMLTTLDLDPEWGAIDLIEEVEKVFSFTITKDEAERCATVGDLYAVICAHTPGWDTQGGKCGSSMTFYRIRRSLDPDKVQGISPRTALTGYGRPFALFRKLSRETGLRLPLARLTPVGMAGGFLLTGGLLAAIVTLLIGQWLISCVVFGIAVFGMIPMWADRGRLPAGVATVGDLVRRTAPLNARGLEADGGRPSDRWSILVSLASEHGSLMPDEIAPETFLHRKSVKLAAAA